MLVQVLLILRLSSLEQAKLKSMEAGTDTATMNALRENQRLTEATKSDIAKNTGGIVAGTVDAMLKAQRTSGRNINSAVADSARRSSGLGLLLTDWLIVLLIEREIQQDISSTIC